MARSQRSRKPSARRKPVRSVRAQGVIAPVGPVPEAPPRPRVRPAERMPVEVTRLAKREMDRLRRLPAGSPEAGSVRTYLQWLWSLPWERHAPENTDLKRVERVLNDEHLGLTKAKERVLEYLAVRRLKPDLPGPVVCLVGPPGTGKSSLGETVARAMHRPFVRISVSGTSDASELVGESRSIPGAQPGAIVRAIRDAGVENPVLMIDGIDRLVGEGGLGVVEVLLDLLDPETSARFTDHYIGLPIDLSRVVFLLCAYNLDLVPDALSERLEIIEIPGYSEDEKIEIARRFLWPRMLQDHGLIARDVTLTEDALRVMVRHYTLEAGVRSLGRNLASVCRKVARARATGTRRRHRVTAENLEKYLGHRIYMPEVVGKEDEVGVAVGLAWTPAGGEILVVEALKMPGTGRVVTTGQLGDVMRESVQAAHSYVRSRAQMLEIDAEAFSTYDIHVHFPAGGVPKDGPSAGITVGLVIASVLSDRPIRHDIAMSGEVSLRGKVLQVGGLREKALAAYRAGFRAMIYPAVNEKDLDDIPADVRERLELISVETMDDVLEVALHRVILPSRISDGFVIEVEDDDDEEESEGTNGHASQSARGRRG